MRSASSSRPTELTAEIGSHALARARGGVEGRVARRCRRRLPKGRAAVDAFEESEAHEAAGRGTLRLGGRRTDAWSRRRVASSNGGSLARAFRSAGAGATSPSGAASEDRAEELAVSASAPSCRTPTSRSTSTCPTSRALRSSSSRSERRARRIDRAPRRARRDRADRRVRRAVPGRSCRGVGAVPRALPRPLLGRELAAPLLELPRARRRDDDPRRHRRRAARALGLDRRGRGTAPGRARRDRACGATTSTSSS